MSKPKFLGEFEIIVLAALIRLGEDAYGVSILNEIENRAGRSVSIGALYSTLTRLEKKHYVKGRMGEATAERGGRAKRYFEITPDGQKQLNKSLTALNNMFNGLDIWPKGLTI